MHHLDLAPRPRSLGLAATALLLLLLMPASGRAETRSRAFVTQHRDLVKALRLYLDPDIDHHKSFAAVEEVLEPMTAAGDRVMADPDRLRWLTDQSRPFRPPFTDRGWRRSAQILTSKRHGRYRRITSEALRLTWSEPQGYNAKNSWRAYPRQDPHPWLISLHAAEDGRDGTPAGVRALTRRWPYAQAKALYESWLVLAPEAHGGEFVDELGGVHLGRTVDPMRAFWEAYHIDHERTILEGGTQAIDLAATFPYLLAGVVLRDAKLEQRHARIIQNFDLLPAFVIGDKRLAAELRLAGHKAVTVGTPAEALVWMAAQRRRLPTGYRWDASHPAHGRSHWLQVESRDPSGLRSTLSVDSVDTKAEPNTIRITCRGIRSISVFLDDRVVDLDRPVRIVINEQLCHTARASHPRFARSFKQTWASPPNNPRKTRFYGQFAPAQAAHIEVPRAR